MKGLRDTDVVAMPCPQVTMQIVLDHKDLTNSNGKEQYEVDDYRPIFAWSKSMLDVIAPYKVGKHHEHPGSAQSLDNAKLIDVFLNVEISKDERGFHKVEVNDLLSFSTTNPWDEEVSSLGIPLHIKYTQEDIVPVIKGLRDEERDILIQHFQYEQTTLFQIDKGDLRDIVSEVFTNASTTSKSRIIRSMKGILGVGAVNEL
jgi:hypothetical protein